MKTITFAVFVVIITTNAAAQSSSQDPLSGVLSGIESFFTSSTRGGVSGTQPTDTGLTNTSPTATGFTTVRTSGDATESSRTLTPSVSLVTDGSSLTLVPTNSADATDTPSASSSGDGDGGGDRVAVIALGTILGALVVGSAFLIFFIIQRRKRPGSSRTGSIFSRRGRSAPTGTAAAIRRNDQGSWLDSLRGRQNPQATPVLPLMSEGSPRYGIFSPKAPWTPASQSNPATQTSPQSVENQLPSRNDVHSGSYYTPVQTSNTDGEDVQALPQTTGEHQDPTHLDAGNPHVQSKPNTPNLLSSKFGQRVLKSAPFLSRFGASKRSPTTFEPANSSANTQTNRSSEPIAEDQHDSARSADLVQPFGKHESSDGFSDAVAGIGFQPLSQGERAPRHGDGSANQATVALIGPNDDSTGQATDPTRPEGDMLPREAAPDRHHRRKSSRVSIPSVLIPGRKKSKRARFSLPGDVSPATETAPSVDIERRPSTISPISPDRSASKGHADLYPNPRRGGSTRARDVETGTLVPRAIPFATPESAAAVKRKPVPLRLGEALRKPLPVPVPTSKYQSKESLTTQTPNSTIREVSGEAGPKKDANGHASASSASMSHKLQPQVPNSSQPRRPSPGELNPRESVGWFKDPANREYAQLYGRYYAQPSPFKFPPSAEGTPLPQQLQFAQNQIPILKAPRPPIRHTHSTPEAFQHYHSPDLTQLPPQIHHQQLAPLGSNPYMPPVSAAAPVPAPPAQSGPPPKPYTHLTVAQPSNGKETRRNQTSTSTWRDSQANAWRDSTSGDGSEGRASAGTNTDLGIQRSISEGSSGGGDGPGLWGEPGYFGKTHGGRQ